MNQVHGRTIAETNGMTSSPTPHTHTFPLKFYSDRRLNLSLFVCTYMCVSAFHYEQTAPLQFYCTSMARASSYTSNHHHGSILRLALRAIATAATTTINITIVQPTQFQFYPSNFPYRAQWKHSWVIIKKKREEK